MRIALLSYQHAYNYGAVFQIAALQQVITSLGHECDIIDYRCEGIEAQYRLRSLTNPRRLLSDIRANLVLLPFISKKKQNFEHWFSQNSATPPIYSRDNLKELNQQYDYFVVGSDQVWNMKCNRYDDSFLLDFVSDDSKKVSYAASFGKYDIPSSWESHLSQYLPSFNSISVREERGSEIVAKYCNKDVPCTMDPVLLVGKDFWLRRMSPRLISEPYVFVYHLGHGKLIPRFLEKSGLRKHRIVYVTGHSGNMIYYRWKDRNLSTSSPEDFLSLLFHAECVVTNSFHATALSVLFEKQFMVVSKGDEQASYNTRIFSLLKRYGMQDRIVFAPFTKFQIEDKGIYNLEKIETDRMASLNYITKALRTK